MLFATCYVTSYLLIAMQAMSRIQGRHVDEGAMACLA